MARGGSRPGAGRKTGSATAKTRDIADKAASDGETPLEYMLKVMRDTDAETPRRDDMAKAAAPYIHAKLAALQVSGDEANPLAMVHRIERIVVRPSDTNG